MTKGRLVRWSVPIILIVVLTMAKVSGYLDFGSQSKLNTPALTSVTAAKAQYVKKTPKLLLTGTVEGETSLAVSTKIAGRIERVLVEDGQEVAAGQTMLTLDGIELANTVKMNQELVRHAAADYDNTATDYARYLALYQQNAISRQQLDSSETKLKIAQADLSSANDNLSNAEQQYANASVITPISGVVADKTATAGQVVSAGMQLMTVENIRQVYAVINVEQKDMAAIKSGLPAEIFVDTYPGKAFPGKVTIINPAALATSRMFRVKIKVDNPEFRLKPGMFVKVNLIVGTESQVVSVPQSAVFQKQGLYYVYCLEGDKVARRQVEIGEVLGESIEIKAGIQALTPVVTSNVNSLIDGDTVKVER